ncbi:DUF885 domain-containing protein [Shewanella salipaludis]|uniref:DUF885 domain-containing protein n=1 Tax=Shewanella salipaludis TaxID=2723052 RepID=A0A972FTN8_9GAMM|nr:DUF885 domain-containing protein [Shewanella salipaludis]NMH65074.1 DUF885 domain-containing protein [Shewanella salipaludis]
MKIKKILKWTGIGLGSVLLLGASFAYHEWTADKPYFANNFYNRAFLKFVLKSPESLTSMGLLDQIGIHGHNADWDDNSLAAGDEQLNFLDEIYLGLNNYPDTELPQNELITKKVVMELLGDPLKQRKFRYYDYPVNQLFGLQNQIPRFLDTFHSVENAQDATYYIARLSKIDTKLKQNMQGLVKREELGIIPPTFVIDKSIEIMKHFVEQPTEENVLYASFKDKLDKVADMSQQARADFLSRAATEIERSVYPGYQSYIDYFTRLRGKSNTDAGVWKFPDGAEYYNYLLRTNTTTDMTADEIHKIGLAEVERIQAEIAGIMAAQGYDISVGFKALIDQLSAEERFYYSDDDAGRQQILADYESIIEEVNDGLGDAFNIRPKAKVVVKRVPEFSEKTAPGAYYNGPSMDGSRPGMFYANLYDVKATPKYSMRTLAYHEAVPGHHFQIAIQNELQDIPMIRTQASFTAYAEGWALYAERLAWELGFQKDPYDNIGRLQAELFRGVRLVVDTGIHAKRWTREQAIRYMLDNTGMAESDVTAEIERYIVMPAQATAYKVGMMEILRLRSEAQTALGDKFNLRDFHDVVLKNGPVPLTLLRALVMDYIKTKQAEALG